MSETIDVAIIGAGPYGLSLAAHLRAANIAFRIFGKPMDAWKMNMPPGMFLKSHPWSSSLYDPDSSFTVKQFCAERAIPYHDSLIPLPLETFIAYGEAFQQRFAPNVEQKLLTGLEATPTGFGLVFDDGEAVTARHVVLAVGVHPFKYIPSTLSQLPKEALSHSGDHGPLDAFVGKEVVILGSGASATDLAALLTDKGASVSMVARADEIRFDRPRTKRQTLLRRLASPLRPLIYPGSGIGGTWLLKICADAPWLIHLMPERWRLRLVRNALGPLGHSAMTDRVVGKVPLLLGRSVEHAEMRGGRVHLRLVLGDGSKETLQTDHVIAATGYRIDLRRLSFLGAPLLARIRSVENTPILSANYETSIPGLYFVGPASANSFGPVARFVFGAIHPSRRLVRHFSRSLPRRSPTARSFSSVFSTAAK